jgi:replicative DNA helicase
MVNDELSLYQAMVRLSEKHFFGGSHKIFYLSMIDLAKENKEVNHYSMLLKMKQDNTLEEFGGSAALSNFMSSYPSTKDFDDYSKQLIQMSQKRELIMLSSEMIKNVDRCEGSPEKVIIEFQKKICSIGDEMNTKETKTNASIYENFRLGMSFPDYLDHMVELKKQGKETHVGVKSGYKNIDDLIGCFANSSLTYIGARASMGKTTFISNLMINQMFGDNPKKILFFSLEMPSESIFAKVVASKSGVQYKSLHENKCTEDELHAIKYAGEILKSKGFFYEDQPGMNLSMLVSKARMHCIAHGIDIIYVDYLTLLKSDNKQINKHLQVDELSKGLQYLARELEIPIVCLAQLNRAVESRTCKRPTKSDFRECGSIEEDADTVILLYRPGYYDEYDKPNVMEVIVDKNRIRDDLGTVELVLSDGRLQEQKPVNIEGLYEK